MRQNQPKDYYFYIKIVRRDCCEVQQKYHCERPKGAWQSISPTTRKDCFVTEFTLSKANVFLAKTHKWYFATVPRTIFFIFFFSFIILLTNTEALSVLNRCSVTESSIFTKANDFYRGGQYPQAIEEYKKIEKTGFESGNLYYNLGNCYFKTGHLGQAVLYYEKAAKLIPRDSDLKSNYTLAKTKISDYSVVSRQNSLLKLSVFLFGDLTNDELTVIMSLFYMVCIGIFLIRVFRPALNLSLRPVLFIALAFFVFGVYSLTEKIKLENKEVIVLSPQTKVRFEPFKKATVFFELSEGAKAVILQQKGNWAKIMRSDGKTGWVPKDTIGLIQENRLRR